MSRVVKSSSYPTRKANLKPQEPQGGLSGRKLSAKRYLALFQELGIFSASGSCTFVQSGVHWRGELLLSLRGVTHAQGSEQLGAQSPGKAGQELCSVTEQQIQPGQKEFSQEVIHLHTGAAACSRSPACRVIHEGISDRPGWSFSGR